MLLVLRRTATFAQQTQTSFQRFLDFSGSVRLFEGLEKELYENEEYFEPESVSPDFDQPIRLDNVSFGYDGSPPVLDSVSLVIPPRQKGGFRGRIWRGQDHARDAPYGDSPPLVWDRFPLGASHTTESIRRSFVRELAT